MNKNLTYILGATVLVGGAYLFLKNKKAKDLSTLAELGGTTTGGTTTGGTTTGGTTPPLSTTSDGVSPSDANINLANATLLASQRKDLVAQTKPKLSLPSFSGGGSFMGGTTLAQAQASANQSASIQLAKIKLVELDKKLATLGYKVDAIGQLVKI
jgi:hypothetical protein